LGDECTKIIPLSKSRSELAKKLQNDSINILYAAAFLKMNIERWKSEGSFGKEGIDISENVGILATLYSNGPRKPNTEIKVNKFGITAKNFYIRKNLLQWFEF